MWLDCLLVIARTLNVKHAMLRSHADRYDLYRGGAFDKTARRPSIIQIKQDTERMRRVRALHKARQRHQWLPIQNRPAADGGDVSVGC